MGTKKKKFNPAGEGFDMDSALGSVVPTSLKQMQDLGLPQDSYMILKGAKHPTFPLAVDAELKRGFKVIQRGDRFFSVPKDFQE